VVLWVSSGAFETPREKRIPSRALIESSEVALDLQAQVPEVALGEMPFLSDSGGGVASLATRLSSARRPVLFLGLGAVGSADRVRDLAEWLNAPVFTTASARGIIPEDHPLCLGFDFDGGGIDILNALLATSDLVLAMGCKLGHSGTGGYRLVLEEDRLVHVNTDHKALGANYPASLLVKASVEELVARLLESLSGMDPGSAWQPVEVSEWRSRIADADPLGHPEPSAPGAPSRSVREVIQTLRDELPRDAIVVTDSGLHQMMIRRHFRVLAPRGLVMPTDFQSMGFGLPAAIGAKLAAPEREVVAVIGDGGLAMSGMELQTLVREQVPVTVFVFNDGYLNLIRLQQERDFGHGHTVRLQNPDMEILAEACGVAFVRLDEDLRSGIRQALGGGVPTLVDVPLGESRQIRSVRRATRTKILMRRVLGERLVTLAKGLLGKGGQ
jgi:acetolactate synthase-1/2/3 large subunit